MRRLNVGLLNDSFPPTIDGVANVTVNYADIINRKLGTAVVATPYYPNVTDKYLFDVIRYPSLYINKEIGYRAGYPFDVKTLLELDKKGLDIIHTHCPFVSTVLARELRRRTGAPIVFTYHTKFDIDIDKAVASDSLRKASVKFILNNINACDDVWVVSNGAGENLRSLGYEGDYIVMENGVDFSRGRSDEERVQMLREKHGIKPDETVFLFVGRMMWYKGVRLSLDGLRLAKEKGKRFRFILVGDGVDRPEMESYAEKIGLKDECVFTGSVRDRELLRDYFTLADLFLFPSTFDTNGIVVREAAACYCPSLLIKGSCAAEDIEHGDTGVIIEETAEAMAAEIIKACEDRERLKRIGENAAEKIYISWEDAVKRAYDRYLWVLEKRENEPREESALTEDFLLAVDLIIDGFVETKEQINELFWDTRDWVSKLAAYPGELIKTGLRFTGDSADRRSLALRERSGLLNKTVENAKSLIEKEMESAKALIEKEKEKIERIIKPD